MFSAPPTSLVFDLDTFFCHLSQHRQTYHPPREHKGDVLRGTAETFTGEVDKVMGWGVNARVHMVGEGDQREKVRIRILAKLGQVLAGPGRACWKFGLWWGAVGGGGGKEVVEKIWGEGKEAAR